MTAKFHLIYALGGGNGHIRRALVFAEKLLKKNQLIFIYTNELNCLKFKNIKNSFQIKLISNISSSLIKNATSIFVDTFPMGIYGELRDFLKKPIKSQNRFLISRYNKSPTWLEEIKFYDELISPYDEENSEWQREKFINETYSGLLINKNFTSIHHEKQLLILDPENKFPLILVNRLKKSDRHHLKVLNHWNFDEIHYGDKTLCIGAGYHSIYERNHKRFNVRCIPLERRFDDQFYRAKKNNVGIFSINELFSWVHQ